MDPNNGKNQFHLKINLIWSAPFAPSGRRPRGGSLLSSTKSVRPPFQSISGPPISLIATTAASVHRSEYVIHGNFVLTGSKNVRACWRPSLAGVAAFSFEAHAGAVGAASVCGCAVRACGVPGEADEDWTCGAVVVGGLVQEGFDVIADCGKVLGRL